MWNGPFISALNDPFYFIFLFSMDIYMNYNYHCLLGIHIINLRKTWEKLVLAARIIAGIENPADVCVISARPYGTVSCFIRILH